MSDDPSDFLERLAGDARRVAPSAAIETEVERSLGDRLAGRPGRTVALRLAGDEHRWTLAHERGRWRPEVARVVGGIVIAREQPALAAWLDGFAAEVAVQAARAAGDAAAARRVIAALRGESTLFAVDREDVPDGLTRVVDQARRRLPPDAAAAVERIAGLLGEALPRAEGDSAALVERTATVYLPDTLRAHAALPAGWTGSGVLRDGATADDALRDQLASIEQAATRMRDAAVADDADALLLNGLFLRERFDT